MLIVWDCVKAEQWMSISLRSAWVMCATFEQTAGAQIASGGLDNIVSIYHTKHQSPGTVGAVGMRAAMELCGHESYVAACRFLDPQRCAKRVEGRVEWSKAATRLALQPSCCCHSTGTRAHIGVEYFLVPPHPVAPTPSHSHCVTARLPSRTEYLSSSVSAIENRSPGMTGDDGMTRSCLGLSLGAVVDGAT